MVDMHETAVGFEPVDAAVEGADPDRAVRVFNDRTDVVAGYRRQVARLVAPMREGLAVGFEAVQSRRFAAAPQPAIAIDEQRGHVVGRD